MTTTPQSQVLELAQRELPKWPQMLVTGVPVTVEQAKEIIRRTDTFFTWGGGNGHDYNRWVRQTLGMPPAWRDRDINAPPDPALAAADRAWQEKLYGEWGYIRTSYVHNDWISCAFVYGPHGWCHPDGQIGFVDNVGKWPSVTEIFEDWQDLARAFPFLDLAVTLHSGESCEEERKPVVSLLVKEGSVVLAEPSESHHANHPPACRRAGATDDSDEALVKPFSDPNRERGIPDEWIHEWAARFNPNAPVFKVGLNTESIE